MGSASFDLRLATPFTVLGEELHLGRAAARLDMSPAALAQQVARLERQVGTRLVDRDGRKLALTPAGTRFLVESRAIVARALEAQSSVRDDAGELRVHLGDPSNGIPREVLTTFMAAHPTVRVRIFEGSQTQSTQALVDGDADIAFDVCQAVPVGTAYTPLHRAPLGVVTSLDHPIARRGTATWSDLEGEPVFISPLGIADGWVLLLRIVARRTGVRWADVVGPRVSQATFLITQLLEGRALLVVGSYILDPVPPGLAWTALEPFQDVEIGVLWNDRSPSAAVRSFVAWAVSRSLADPASGVDAAPPAFGERSGPRP